MDGKSNASGQAAPPGPAFTEVVAASPEMLAICRMAARVAACEVGVMLTGESGTGKDLLARAIHAASARHDDPFVAINCAAIPENLLESELFGHEKGAFTGAVRQVIGKIEQADKGVLFLDEIGDMPLALQAKLLRFLQDKTIMRVGGRKPIVVDLRVVAATNKDLPAMMAAGTFRPDLYYRLNEVAIHIPPLRQRTGDSALIAHHLLRQWGARFARGVAGFTRDALAAIEAHDWPGNVRELENRIKRAVVLADGKRVTAADLGLDDAAGTADPGLPTLRQVRAEAERDAVARALGMAGNNLSEAARLLGVSRPTLYELMKSLQPRGQNK